MKFDYYTDVNPDTTWIQLNVEKMLREDLKNFRGKRVHITLDRAKSKRSVQQNALFHMYVGIIARELGYGGRDGAEEMKEIIKYKFLLTEKIDEHTGEIFKYIQPTHLLSKFDFIGLIDSVIRWASGLGIRLPDPSDYGYERESQEK